MVKRRNRATPRPGEAAEPAAILAWASRASGQPARTCRNNCIFCFIDQNPPGCRESLYVKDDDARLSFLLGNYITLTNLSEQEVTRICGMKISPLGISVHTTDPALRVRMLRNKQAGGCFPLMRRFAESGVRMNAQIVLCPGYNDGDALISTLTDLQTLGDAIISTSIVPVGLTKHREGLHPLRPVAREDALAAIDTASRFQNVWCADEIFLKAETPIPPAKAYGDFPQLDNGVGMMALFADEWESCWGGYRAGTRGESPPPQTAIATGVAAAPMLAGLLKDFSFVEVVAVENRFFGPSVTVAGLLTGSDLLSGLEGRDLGGRVLIPSVMLRKGGEVFLDDMTVTELSEKLGVPVIPVEPDAGALLEVLMCGQ
jgi:putative radical SAM enzyme (TIGR03279 family)